MPSTGGGRARVEEVLGGGEDPGPVAAGRRLVGGARRPQGLAGEDGGVVPGP